MKKIISILTYIIVLCTISYIFTSCEIHPCTVTNYICVYGEDSTKIEVSYYTQNHQDEDVILCNTVVYLNGPYGILKYYYAYDRTTFPEEYAPYKVQIKSENDTVFILGYPTLKVNGEWCTLDKSTTVSYNEKKYSMMDILTLGAAQNGGILMIADTLVHNIYDNDALAATPHVSLP